MPRIQHKRGTSANLASVNPTPLAGELVWDSTENAIKIGDGATAWTSLAYVTATPRSHTHTMANISDISVEPAGSPPRTWDVALTFNYATSSWVAKGIGNVGIGSQPLGGWPSGSVGAELAGKVDTSDSRLTDARTPTAHKATHATGGSDALTPADIGAAPAASPAITGNATFEASSGVPVTITNTGTGNSFVVNDAAGDTSPFVVDASGQVGVGVTPEAPLHIKNSNFLAIICERTTAAPSGIEFRTPGGAVGYLYGLTDGGLRFFVNNGAGGTLSETVRISPLSRVGINNVFPTSALDVNGVITVSATSGSAGSYLPSVTFSGDANTGFGQVSGQSDSASVFTAGHERVRVDASGRVGIGRTPSVSGTSLEVAGDVYQAIGKSITFYTSSYGIGTPNSNGLQIFSGDAVRIGGRASGVFTEYARVDCSGATVGNVGIGTTSPSARLDINADKIRLRTAKTPSSASDTGNAGDICWDASYLYICTATNTWRRIAHSTW